MAAIARLTEELATLTTDDERETFPFHVHLLDLIEELEMDS